MKQTLRCVTAVVTACCLFATGCSTPTRKPVDLPIALVSPMPLPTPIAVVSVREATQAAPATAIATNPADGALGGAVGGAVAGAAIGLPLSAQAAVSAAVSGAASVAVLPALAGFALIGLVIGTISAISASNAALEPERIAEIERIITSRLDELGTSKMIARHAVRAILNTGTLRSEWLGETVVDSAEAAPDYRALSEKSFATVLEVRLRRVSFSRMTGEDPKVALVVVAEGRFVDAGTGEPATSRHVAYQSPIYPISEWAKDDGRLLRAAFTRAADELGERLVDTLLLGAETSPIANVRMGGIVPTSAWSCGLRPSAPAPFEFTLGGPAILDETVGTQFPELSWQAFPPPDWIGANAPLAHANNIVYDVRIWDGSAGTLGGLVYERYGLPSPRHRVEQELPANTRHLWSVRARYQVGDRRLATRWSASQRPVFFPDPHLRSAASEPVWTGRGMQASPCTGSSQSHDSPWTPCYCLDFIPYPNHYRFRTP